MSWTVLDHMRQIDWFTSLDHNFINEEDLDSSCTEKILRNEFYNPLQQCSDSGKERTEPVKIDWSDILQAEDDQNHKSYGKYVPCLKKIIPYLKKSALTEQQHYQCLKVLCAEKPKILEAEFIPRPMKSDFKVFQEVKDKYLREQTEFRQWAKTLWVSDHCIRALRPKPLIEEVYEAEFQIRARMLECFPKNYTLAAQIPMEVPSCQCELLYEKDLKHVDTTELPQIEFPNISENKCTLLGSQPHPQPCNKHLCKFILPFEKSMSVLPLTEIHWELARYALDNECEFIASESALKCLVEKDRPWTIPVSVCETLRSDGEKINVIILGSEFSVHKPSSLIRTYKAYKHLLHYAFIPTSEKAKLIEKLDMILEEDIHKSKSMKDTAQDTQKSKSMEDAVKGDSENIQMNVCEVDSDDEDNAMVIDLGELHQDNISSPNREESIPNMAIAEDNEVEDITNNNEIENVSSHNANNSKEPNCENESVNSNSFSDKNEEDTPPISALESEPRGNIIESLKTIGVFNCTCKDSIVEAPPPRSFRKWRVRNITKGDKYDIIVHCPHKVRGTVGEVILEPIPEYQIDLGASKLSDDRIRSCALSLHLRRNASLVTVRLDAVSGEVASFEQLYQQEFNKRYGDQMPAISNVVYSVVDQLQGLLPGHYILQHEPGHGTNAMLYAAKKLNGIQKLSLEFDSALHTESDEAKNLQTAPVLTDELLPMHKYRKILPCAFTPFERQVAPEPKKPPARQKAPPQAIKWPQKKGRRKRKNN